MTKLDSLEIMAKHIVLLNFMECFAKQNNEIKIGNMIFALCLRVVHHTSL